MTEIIVSVIAFTLVILVLLLVIFAARRALVPSGSCEITINDQLKISADVGDRLLNVLNQAGTSVPGACGGVGTCGLCKVRIIDDPGAAKPQEKALLTRKEIANGTRLACQISIQHPLSVKLDDACFGAQNWRCEVLSVTALSTLIREIVLKLPEDAEFEFRPGGFVQLTCPPYNLDFSDIEIEQPYGSLWDKNDLWSLQSATSVPVTRAYSMANRHDDKGVIRLNIRIALPPPQRTNVPPGIVSSWLFSLRPGDPIDVSGCFGHFQVMSSDREAIFIGGGVGMAPLYAQIMHLFHIENTHRKVSLWYGARCKRELYYQQDMQQLHDSNPNFSWHVALSEPEPEDQWQGPTGFIHQVLLEEYLGAHPAPEDCEYYLCGPPLMIKAVFSVLDNLGVDADNIFYDDFGGA